LYRPNSAATARLGVVIAKKHVRSAVNRNLVRRIVRESFRLIRAHLPKMDIVVRVSPGWSDRIDASCGAKSTSCWLA
jgi:ribonuclease P protein component